MAQHYVVIGDLLPGGIAISGALDATFLRVR